MVGVACLVGRSLASRRRNTVKSIATLPNLLTLANAACGLLAISRALDALSADGDNEFFVTMKSACFLIFLAMIFDGLDGMVARLTKTTSDFGAQLDSFADAITFGVAPAVIAKAFLQHQGPQLPRLAFATCACFTLLAILRLARFNLESNAEQKKGKFFRGLPTPTAAGSVVSLMWVYLVLKQPDASADGLIEKLATQGWGESLSMTPTLLLAWMPLLGLLMVSRIRYPHGFAWISSERSNFFNLVAVVFIAGALYLEPELLLFSVFHVVVFLGLARSISRRGREDAADVESAA